MANAYFLGECMIELRALDNGNMSQSFAGDVYNSAVYLKRCFPQINCAMMTAVGRDSLSQKMLRFFEDAEIDTKFVFKHDSKVPGVYYIETDQHGERTFTYWRSNSAARSLVQFLSDELCSNIKQDDLVFFSGISLAVIREEDRTLFWDKLSRIKARGARIAFDPNYRARLWSSPDEAKQAFDKAFKMADIALPGVEDFATLYGIDLPQDALDYCCSLGVRETVLTNGSKSVLSVFEAIKNEHQVTPVSNVVDTTSAGDAFNGAYLGARMMSRDVASAIALASKASAIVIQHPGAIVDSSAFSLAMQ